MFVQFYRWLITGNALCFFNKSNFNLPKGQPEAINENTIKLYSIDQHKANL
jgi:hypothetical protein